MFRCGGHARNFISAMPRCGGAVRKMSRMGPESTVWWFAAGCQMVGERTWRVVSRYPWGGICLGRQSGRGCVWGECR